MDDKDFAKKVKEMMDEKLFLSMAEARRWASAGFTAEDIKKRRAKKQQSLMSRRDYGESDSSNDIRDRFHIQVDKSSGWGPESVTIRDFENMVAYLFERENKVDPDRHLKPLVDLARKRGRKVTVDEGGGKFRKWVISEDGKITELSAGSSLKHAAEGPEKEFSHILQSMKTDDLDFVGTVRAMLNERLVSSIGEARRLAENGVSVEDLRGVRGGKNMSKGKWAAVDMGQTAYIDRVGGQYEIRLPDGSVEKAGDDRDEAYAVVQRYAMKSRKQTKLVDVQEGTTKEVDPHGNIEESDMGSKLSSRLDSIADRLEAHGMREAAERLDVVSNSIEAGGWKEHHKRDDDLKKVWEVLNALVSALKVQTIDGKTVQQSTNVNEIIGRAEAVLLNTSKAVK